MVYLISETAKEESDEYVTTLLSYIKEQVPEALSENERELQFEFHLHKTSFGHTPVLTFIRIQFIIYFTITKANVYHGINDKIR